MLPDYRMTFNPEPRTSDRGERNELVCTVYNATNVQGVISIIRVLWGINITFGNISQSTNSCQSLFILNKHYEIFCKEGTDSASADKKVYRFIIRYLRYQDYLRWWCVLEAKNGEMVRRSATVNAKSRGK